jgi:hypothetical protein
VKPIRTGAVFLACATLGGVMLPVSFTLMWAFGVPALLLPPLAFMIAGGLAGATIDDGPSKGVVRLAWAFAAVGISALTFGMITHFAEAGRVLFSGGGAFLIGFGLAGVVAGVGGVSGKRAAAVVLAFALGGLLGASAAVSVRLFAHWNSLNSAALGAIVGLGAAGVFMAWFARPRGAA